MENHADVAGNAVPSFICCCINHICISKGESTKLMCLGDVEISSRVVVEDWFVPLDVHVRCACDELGRGFAEIDHRVLNV